MAASLPFDVSFDEGAAYFADKIVLTREEFDALADWAKRRAFTVANVSSADILQDVMDAVELGITDGITLADFMASLDDIMATRGWEGTTPWHSEAVFRTNVQSAYGAGRLEQQQAQADDFPAWLYVAHDADDECDDLNGSVFAIDDTDAWPPIHINCRCGTEPLTAAEAEELGGVVESPDLGLDFAGPGVTDEYEPDYSTYDGELADDVRKAIEGFDPGDFEA